MEYKMLLCEECDNVVSVEDNDETTFICPVCGTINDRKRSKSFNGILTILSPRLNCKIGTDENAGVIGITDADEDLLDALIILTKHGWTMKFKGDRAKD